MFKERHVPSEELDDGLLQAMFTLEVLNTHSFVSASRSPHQFVATCVCFCTYVLFWNV